MTRRECNILECEFKWILGSISTNKASVSDGIPAGLLKILKDDAVKVLHSMPANLENSAEATELEKVNFHSNPKEGQCQRCHTVAHISQASKVVLKTLQACLSQLVN